MAWIESHQTLAGHPKLLKLARELDISVPTAVGHLHCLWWWALDYASDGCLGNYDLAEVEEAAKWQGHGGVLYTALINCNWIDPGNNLHDWNNYAGAWLLGKQRQKRYRERMNAQRNGDVTETTTVPNHTIPNHTIPKQQGRFQRPEPKQVEEYGRTINFTVDGQQFCDYYEAKGWKIGTSPMKSWQAAVRTWKNKRGGALIGKGESRVGKTGGFVPTKAPLF